MTCHEYILRQEETYHIICTSADVCRVPPYGTPVPFNIHETLDQTTSVATQSNVNGHRIYTYRSRTIRVRGDEPGRYKGIVSGTVGAPARPIAHSLSVRVECSYVVRVCDLHEMNDGNTHGKVVHSSPPRKDRIIDKGKNKPAKLSHDFAGGMCKQLKLSPEACAKLQTSDFWKQQYGTFKHKAEELYDQTAHYLKTHSTEEIVSNLNDGINTAKEAASTLIDETVDYYKNTPGDQILEDAKTAGGKVLEVGEEMVSDAWGWVKDTYHNLANSKSASEAAGVVVAAGAEVINPRKKGKLAIEAAEKVEQKLEKEALKRQLEKEAAKKKAEREAAQKEYKSGGSVHGLKRKLVKCFCVKDDAKGGRAEYERQLKDQQNGLNNMTADEYIANRQAYSGKDICGDGYSGGKTKFRDPSVTREARKNRLNAQSKKYKKEFRDKGLNPKKSRSLGEKKAEMELGKQAATHTPDLGAGGEDVISMMGDVGFGDSDVNSHIGSQWNGDRVSAIDQQACEAKKSGKGKEKMNVQLRACGKKEAKKMGCDKKNRDRRKQKGLW